MPFTVILNVHYFLNRGIAIVFLLLCSFSQFVKAQVIISGTVYDSTKIYPVPGVIVKSTNGSSALTDSSGTYFISASEKDSVSFLYNNKSTVKYPVSSINNYNEFDISLRMRLNEQYKFLKEVKIYTKSYKQDSAENRLAYSKIFSYQKPGLSSTYTPGSPPGLDIDELINIFGFRRNKQHLAFQKRLEEEEQDKYINYRFNTNLLKRVTGLSGPSLEKYKLQYRPTYEFLTVAAELDFYEYILNTSAHFKKNEGLN